MLTRSQSRTLRLPESRGGPSVSVGSLMPANLFSVRDANRADRCCCSSLSMLTPNLLADSRMLRLRRLLPTQIRIRGGSSDTEVKQFAVNPRGVPSGSYAVTTVTPVRNVPKRSRSCRASELSAYVSATSSVIVMPPAVFQRGRYSSPHGLTDLKRESGAARLEISEGADQL